MILETRLRNTGLTTAPFKNAAEALSALGAVQSQDFSAAKWALGMRIKNATEESIDNAFNAGEILRTHILRPTWHFVHPQDIRWMLDLTAPNVKSRLATYDRKLEITESLIKKSNAAIAKALRHRTFLTRQDLKTKLSDIGIATNTQRLAHIVIHAELDGIICSGARLGKQFSYALLDDRAPKTKPLDRNEALAKLALTYFKSHGPAQLKDFSWWSGLSAKDATDANDSVRAKLEQKTLDGKTFWFAPNAPAKSPKPPAALLLSLFDEYIIAYTDRSHLSPTGEIERFISTGNALTAVIILDGKVGGTWKKKVHKKDLHVTLNLFGKISKNQRNALETEAERLGTFFSLRVSLAWGIN